jgi:TnpA family transposase
MDMILSTTRLTDEVDTSQLLQRLEQASSQESLAKGTLEAVRI